MEAGVTYSHIADRCLKSWYSDLSPEQRHKILENGNFEAIENMICAKGSIEAAASAIQRGLELAGVCLPSSYVDTIYSSENPDRDLMEFQRAICRCGLSPEAKSEIALRALVAVHDYWVKNNVAKFFDEKYVDEQYKFLPAVLVGYDDIFENYIFFEDILTLLYIHPEHQYLSREYYMANRQYKQLHHLSAENDLTNFIRHIDYAVLPKDVIAAMNDETVARRIARQTIEKDCTFKFWQNS